MNQTKKRLTIIKLAISMTDKETIQLQVLKLGMLKTDSKMREIISTLSESNYVQAQRLISNYIAIDGETTVIQRSSQEEENIIDSMFDLSPQKDKKAKDKAIIEQFSLFTKVSKEDTPKEADNYDTYLDTAAKDKTMSTQDVNYDALLNVNAEDVLKDTNPLVEEKLETLTEDLNTKNENNNDVNIEKVLEKVSKKDVEKKIDKEEEALTIEEQKVDSQFKAISYIDQKLKNMQTQYPPVHESTEDFSSVNTWLLKISNDGYSEIEAEEMIKQIGNLSLTNKAEAAKLLLITAATESKYAQFSLARALYKGELLQKNLAEAFTLINRLAINDDYPEAICDLAQFYENGVGIAKDKKKAEQLYKEAMDLGVYRAIEHHKRVHKQNKGFFSFMK